MLRTGTMISASAGNGGSGCRRLARLLLRQHFDFSHGSSRFLQGDHQTAVGDGAAHAAVAPGRQPQPPVKAALRQFEPMNDGGAPGRPDTSRAGDDQIAVLDHGFARFRHRRRAKPPAPEPRIRSPEYRPAAPRPAAAPGVPAGRNSSRCIRSARASISHASDHIQSRATSRAMGHPLQLWMGLCVAIDDARIQRRHSGIDRLSPRQRP